LKLSNFWPFKKKNKPHLKIISKIKLTHKNGEIITVIVEGDTPECVSFISNKIKNDFNINKEIQEKADRIFSKSNQIWKESEKVWKESEKVWKESEKVWDEFDKVIDTIDKVRK
jgi:hypothetical protein